MLVLVLAVAGVGIFLGNWAWQAYAERRAAEARMAELAVGEQERASPRGRQREAVLALLHDPGSANFRNVRQGRTARQWCGEVNARNRMGGYTGFTLYYVTLSDVSPALDQVDIQPAVDDEPALRLFGMRFDVWCFPPPATQ